MQRDIVFTQGIIFELNQESPSALRQSVITGVAQACARLHHHRLQHSCLYGKHLFVNCRPAPNDSRVQEDDVRFIDLEKLRRGFSRQSVGAHDLDQLMRHTPGLGERDRETFLAAYRQQRAVLRQAPSTR
jgi:hypothetical protein